MWFDVRRHRLTASMFGEVMRRKTGTPPDSLVLRILEHKHFTSAALEWGMKNEPVAIQKYVEMQLACGHDGLSAFPSGFIISESYPFLGATPDGSVYDPSCREQPYGLLEVKCPYSKRNVPPLIFVVQLIPVHKGKIRCVLKGITYTMHRFRAKWGLASARGVTLLFTHPKA